MSGFVEIINQLGPANGGPFPTHDANFGKGGEHVVADLTARDAITTERRVEGMTAYVVGTSQTFRLVGGTTNGDWQLDTGGGGGLVNWTEDGSGNITPNGSAQDLGSPASPVGAFVGDRVLAVSGTSAPTLNSSYPSVNAINSGANSTVTVGTTGYYNYGAWVNAVRSYGVGGTVTANLQGAANVNAMELIAASGNVVINNPGRGNVAAMRLFGSANVSRYNYNAGSFVGVASNAAASGNFVLNQNASGVFCTIASGGTYYGVNGINTVNLTAPGGAVHGYMGLSGNNTFTASGRAAFIGGVLNGGSTMNAAGQGAFVHANLNTGASASSNGAGTFLAGNAVGAGATLRTDGNGSFVMAEVGAGEVAAADVAGAHQFGVGVNTVSRTTRMGVGWRFYHADGAPGVPANGDAWIDTGVLAIQSAGVTQTFSRPTITGSRGGNAALTDLLSQLDTAGLIDDQTTA